MKDLRQILKANGQNAILANKKGKFKFNKKAGCKVYVPPAEKLKDLKN